MKSYFMNTRLDSILQKYKRWLMSLCLFIFPINLSGQGSSESGNTDPYRPQVIPPLPQAAIYQKYLTHKVDESTGIPDIRVPLYDIEIKGMKIPIVLSYHASGVKAHQYDGDMGAGWSINVGGYKVLRSIYGQEDEVRPHYSNSSWQTHYAGIDNNSPGPKRMEKDLYLTGFTANSTTDGEYDHFSYILPSSSGDFIIQNGSNASTINALIAGAQRDRITFINGNDTYSFRDITITDEQGTIYQLGGDARECNIPHSFYTTGWPLLKMTTSYKEEVIFEYGTYATDYNIPEISRAVYREAPFLSNWIRYIPSDTGSGFLYGSAFADLYPAIDATSPSSMIRKITTPYCRIVFIRKGDTVAGTLIKDRYAWHQLITGIEIYDNNSVLIKKIDFDYVLADGSIHPHNLLKSAIISGQQSSPQEKYRFAYYESSAAPWTAPNEWGYGGAGNYLHDFFTTRFELLFRSAINEIHDEYLNLSFLLPPGQMKFADRAIEKNPTPPDYSLKRITFPTGGFTEYEYEPHIDDSGYMIGGLRVKKINSKSSETANPIVTEFQYANAHFSLGLSPLDFADETYDVAFSYPTMTEGVDEGSKLGYRSSRTLIFSTTPILSDLLNFKAFYGKVITSQYDPARDEYNGKIVSVYDNLLFEVRDIPPRAIISPIISEEIAISRIPTYRQMLNRKFWIDSYMGYSPTLKSRTYYDRNNHVKKTDEYTYTDIRKGIFPELRVFEKIRMSFTKPIGYCEEYKYVSTCFDYVEYDLRVGFNRLESKTTTEYVDSGTTVLGETYTYNANHQLINKAVGRLSESYTYPENFTDPVYRNMVSANILSPVIEKTKYNYIFSISETERIKTNYANRNGIFLPVSMQSKTPTADYRTEISFDQHDSNGNIVQCTTLDGVSTVYLWAYNGRYPIAEIKNATYSQVTAIISQATLDAISAKPNPDISDLTLIENLRINPALEKAAITTYAYQPLIGIRSITDPAGVSTYYNYDSLGRLICIRDNEGKTIEDYQYHYPTL